MFPIPNIPLDVVVIIAKYCIEDDLKMAKTFYSLCAKIQKKPYIRKSYLKYKRENIRKFLEELAYFSKHDGVSNMSIILSINDIEHAITCCENSSYYSNYSFSHICFFKKSELGSFDRKGEYMWKIITNTENNLDEGFLIILPFKRPTENSLFNHISDPQIIESFSWTNWGGITRINVKF